MNQAQTFTHLYTFFWSCIFVFSLCTVMNCVFYLLSILVVSVFWISVFQGSKYWSSSLFQILTFITSDATETDTPKFNILKQKSCLFVFNKETLSVRATSWNSALSHAPEAFFNDARFCVGPCAHAAGVLVYVEDRFCVCVCWLEYILDGLSVTLNAPCNV